jgi:hypothetical protein
MLLLASFYSGLHLRSQISLSPQVLSAGGKDFQNTQFQLTYTIGEMSAVSTLSAGSSIATQGFNQPDKFTIASVEGPEWGNGIVLYPNPAINAVIIQYDETLNASLRIEILDQTGRLVCPAESIPRGFASGSIRFAVNQLAAGIYTANICLLDEIACKTIRFTKLP